MRNRNDIKPGQCFTTYSVMENPHRFLFWLTKGTPEVVGLAVMEEIGPDGSVINRSLWSPLTLEMADQVTTREPIDG